MKRSVTGCIGLLLLGGCTYGASSFQEIERDRFTMRWKDFGVEPCEAELNQWEREFEAMDEFFGFPLGHVTLLHYDWETNCYGNGCWSSPVTAYVPAWASSDSLSWSYLREMDGGLDLSMVFAGLGYILDRKFPDGMDRFLVDTDDKTIEGMLDPSFIFPDENYQASLSAAISFVRFLLDTFGNDAFRAFLANDMPTQPAAEASFRAAFGVPFIEALDAWKTQWEGRDLEDALFEPTLCASVTTPPRLPLLTFDGELLRGYRTSNQVLLTSAQTMPFTLPVDSPIRWRVEAPHDFAAWIEACDRYVPAPVMSSVTAGSIEKITPVLPAGNYWLTVIRPSPYLDGTCVDRGEARATVSIVQETP